MESVTIAQAIADVEQIFGLTETTSQHRVGSGRFLLRKENFPRELIISKLRDYFCDRFVEGGGCYISPMTIAYTHVEIATIDRINKL